MLTLEMRGLNSIIKKLEREEQNKLKAGRRKKMINIRAKFNKIKNREKSIKAFFEKD